MTGDRPIRILLAILGLDQHEAGAFAVAGLLRDAGMEVIYLGRFGTPETVVGSALEEGVDVIGLSCHSWEYLYYLDELLDLLKRRGLDIPVVIGGSVLSGDDRAAIPRKGVAATFGPGSDSAEIVEEIRGLAEGRGAA
jgi:methylmalonyl-CoA mutase C-terminal domain/subunit